MMRRSTAAGVLLGLVGLVSGAGAEDGTPSPPPCRGCHEETVTPYGTHGQAACAVCHGDGRLHAQAPGRQPAPPRSFAPAHKNEEGTNGLCLKCHDDSLRAYWPLSPHERMAVGCTECHAVHREADPVRSPHGQLEVCGECHRAQRAELHKPSRHPVAAGKMDCGDCHAPHGSLSDRLGGGLTTNQTCYRCHADKRGPFLWEHAPVREDCTTCHVPHGSNHPALLTVRSPFLCQQCHSMAGHPSESLSPGSIAQDDPRNRFVLLNGCLNCHPRIHGSNHPSGVKLNR